MEVEEPVRRKVMTSSIAKPLSLGEKTMTEMRGFELYPTEVVFGVLKEGCCYGYTVTIRNVGIDSCRYKVRPPPPSTGLKVRYTPGPVSLKDVCMHLIHLTLTCSVKYIRTYIHIILCISTLKGT